MPDFKVESDADGAFEYVTRFFNLVRVEDQKGIVLRRDGEIVAAFLSLLFAPNRGAVAKLASRRKFARRMGMEHLLRAMFEITEDHEAGPFQLINLSQIAEYREVKPEYFKRLIGRGVRKGLLVVAPEGDSVALTNEGYVEAARVTRIHRLWEQYLIHAAEFGADHVDHDADLTEHVSSPAIVMQLERYMEQEGIKVISPHVIKVS